MRQTRSMLALWLICCSNGVAQDDQLRERFLTEGPKGWKKIEEWNSELECEGSLTNIISKGPGSTQEIRDHDAERTLLWCQKNSSFVLRVTYPSGSAQVFGLNPRYSFYLTAKKPSAGEPQWQVNALEDAASAVEISPLAGEEQS
jgi:hypothetical protein